ncbi:Tfp pilus assembly protein PilU [Acetobacter malorum DSM 14337]|uniref:Tfp pilus assembly protein PilU n=2 Tax=Acetobacter malorum TaxID=178901 RepID=A0ABQ0PP86_9PROT|nr:Tfp pilus assembly protein PilU [Acetobacter malorum DSM 14337]
MRSNDQHIYGTWRGEVEDCGLRPDSRENWQRIVNKAVRMPMSDLLFETGKPVFVKHHSRLTAITRPLSKSHVENIIGWITKTNSVVFELNGGQDHDSGFTISDIERQDDYGVALRHRFRLNLTPVLFEGGIGFQGIARYFNPIVPTCESIGLEPEIIEYATPEQGGVGFLGPVGSGKSSSGAAVIRHVLEGKTNIRGHIATYEAPIEYEFDLIESNCCTITQVEIPVNLPTFGRGARNSLRRATNGVMVQEMRDRETIEAATELMATGCPLWTTGHANKVAVAFARFMQKFPENLQAQAFYGLIANMRLFVSQRLVRHKLWTPENPKMTCLREWQAIDDDLRVKLEEAGPEKHVRVLQQFIDAGDLKQDVRASRSMRKTIRMKYQAGEISEETGHQMLITYGYHARDLEGKVHER